MFGKTDCSVKIKSYSEEGVNTIVNHYFDFVAMNFGLYFSSICIWGPTHSSLVGTDVNTVTKMFNDNLRKRCEDIHPKYQFYSTFGEIIGSDIEIRDKLLFQHYYPHSFTFGIVTAGDNDEVINTIINSIVSQKIPFYEIIIVGQTNIKRENVINIEFDEILKILG